MILAVRKCLVPTHSTFWPTSRVRQVVMDNFSVHKGERVRKPFEDGGCELCSICHPTAGFTAVDAHSLGVDHVGMNLHSEDLRTRIVNAAQEGGMSKSGSACLFGVSLSSVKRYARITNQGSSLVPRKGSRRPPKANEKTRKLLE